MYLTTVVAMLPPLKGDRKMDGKTQTLSNFLESVGLYIYYCLFIKPSSGATLATPNHYNDWEKLYIFDK